MKLWQALFFFLSFFAEYSRSLISYVFISFQIRDDFSHADQTVNNIIQLVVASGEKNSIGENYIGVYASCVLKVRSLIAL